MPNKSEHIFESAIKGDSSLKRMIDIVVPVRNEQNEIPLFVSAVNHLALPESISIRMIFVEDSSTDHTVLTLRDIAAKSRNVSYYVLKTGFGEAPAVAFGMSRSKAEAVITMEAGGGHPVKSIPEMISRYLDGAEIVQAVRLSLTNRKWYRSVGTAFFNILFRLLTGFDAKKQNVYFRLLAKKQKDLLIHNKSFIATLRFRLLKTNPCRIDHVFFRAEDRAGGKSEYGFGRLVRLSLDFVLAMISTTRLCCLFLFLLILGFILALSASPWSAVVPLFCMVVVAGRTWMLRNNETIEKMQVSEQRESI